jgi:hypothetical protein
MRPALAPADKRSSRAILFLCAISTSFSLHHVSFVCAAFANPCVDLDG